MGDRVGDVNSTSCSGGSSARYEVKHGVSVHRSVLNSCDSAHIECRM